MTTNTLRVDLIDWMGNDLTVVNAARASFGREATVLDDKAISLIEFLANGLSKKEMKSLRETILNCGDPEEADNLINKLLHTSQHWSPFSHVMFTFHLQVPLAIARQLWRHHVGCSGGDVGVPGWNEKSYRYVQDVQGDNFFVPEFFRTQNPDVKQGSSQEVQDENVNWSIRFTFNTAYEEAERRFQNLRMWNVANEQARLVLPMATMTEFYWTGSLAFYARVARQRLDPHAQEETRQVVQCIGDLIRNIAPLSWSALTTGKAVSVPILGGDKE